MGHIITLFKKNPKLWSQSLNLQFVWILLEITTQNESLNVRNVHERLLFFLIGITITYLINYSFVWIQLVNTCLFCLLQQSQKEKLEEAQKEAAELQKQKMVSYCANISTCANSLPYVINLLHTKKQLSVQCKHI